MKIIEIFGKDSRGNYRPIKTDSLGQFVRSYNFRDVIATGQATLTRAQETSILSAVTGKYLDLVYVAVSNESTNAIRVDIRSATGGSVQETIVCGGNNDAIRQLDIPHVQDETSCPWTAQIVSTGEVSDSPITVHMHAIKHDSY